MIRNAVYSDLADIADVHIQCFPDSFSTQLGEKLLIRMYKTYMDKTPELFFVAEIDNKVVGFVNGYYHTFNKYLSTFIKDNKFLFSITVLMRLISFNIPTWKKLFRSIKDKKAKKEKYIVIDTVPNSLEKKEKGDLLSICVCPRFRGLAGGGIANELIEAYENSLLQNQEIKICTLSVDPQNERAIAFYIKHGYTKYQTSKANDCDSYYKLIR